MFFQTENSAIVSADALKHTVTIEKTVIKNRDFCLVVRKVLTINVNDHSFYGVYWVL